MVWGGPVLPSFSALCSYSLLFWGNHMANIIGYVQLLLLLAMLLLLLVFDVVADVAAASVDAAAVDAATVKGGWDVCLRARLLTFASLVTVDEKN